MKLLIKNIPALWLYHVVRWAFGLFFIAIGLLYKDAWAAYLFGAIFIITSFAKRPRCVGTDCSIKD